MFELGRTILEVVKTLLGVSDKLKTAKSERRNNMATLFENISAYLAAVSSEIRSGKIPHGRCGELRTYAAGLPQVVSEELGKAKAAELGRHLRSAYDVERLAMELHLEQDKEKYLQQIEEASGKFRALGNIVRVG